MTTRFKWRDQYDDEVDDRIRDETAINCQDPSLTQQSFTVDCDLNVIAKRYGLTDGSIPQMNISDVIHDFTDVVDFRTALDRINAAKEQFMLLPAHVRARFANNPQIMHDWVMAEENLEEARKLGFITKPPTVEVPPTPPTPPTGGVI